MVLNKGFQDSTRKILEKTNTFRKAVRYINILLKSVAFLYINNKHTEKKSWKLPFTTTSNKQNTKE